MEDLTTKLNQNQNGAVYTQQGNQITGSWNKTAAATGALGGSSIDLNYSVTVSLNEGKSYSYKENLSQTETNAGAKPSGLFSIGGTKTTFSGKTFGTKSAGFSLHPGGGASSNSYSYTFEADKIKQPLLTAVETAGYSKKKGFLGKLFGK